MSDQMELGLGNTLTAYDLFHDVEVGASSFEDFFNRYHRDRSPQDRAALLESYRETLREEGCVWFGQYESVTGKPVAYYPEAARAQDAGREEP